MYDYAYTMVEGKTPKDMADTLHETFAKTISEARATPSETVGIAVTAAILDELLARRIVADRPADLAGDDVAWVRAASAGPSTPTRACP